MTTHDIDLPSLPAPTRRGYGLHYNADEMESYARAAIEADRKRKGEMVVTKTSDGEIIAVTRQDAEGRILSVIAETESKRRGGPKFWYRPRADGCYEGPIHNAQIDEVRKQSGGWMPLYTAPQPDEPVKVPSDEEIFELAHDFSGMTFEDLEVVGFARALLARYGKPAQAEKVGAQHAEWEDFPK